jgi:hypothetical protein
MAGIKQASTRDRRPVIAAAVLFFMEPAVILARLQCLRKQLAAGGLSPVRAAGSHGNKTLDLPVIRKHILRRPRICYPP